MPWATPGINSIEVLSRILISSKDGHSHFTFRTPSGDKYPYLSFRGKDSYFDLDGVDVCIEGPMQWHGDPNNIPQTMVRMSRDEYGSSRNCPTLKGLKITGMAYGSFIRNEGMEVSRIESCWMTAGYGDSNGFHASNNHCIIFTNQRPSWAKDTVENKYNITCSGHTVEDCCFYSELKAPILVAGCSTDIVIANTWFSGPAPALLVADLPDYPNNWNQPMRITLQNCRMEQPGGGQKSILFQGVPLDQVQIVGDSAQYFVKEAVST